MGYVVRNKLLGYREGGLISYNDPQTNQSGTSLDSLASILKLFTGAGKTTTTQSGGSSTTQTQIAPDTVASLLQHALEQNNGLADVMNGQRTSGLYNSTTSSLLANDLVSRLTAQTAAAAAPVVKTVEPTTTTQTQAGPLKSLATKDTGMGLAALTAANQLGITGAVKDKLKDAASFLLNQTQAPTLDVSSYDAAPELGIMPSLNNVDPSQYIAASLPQAAGIGDTVSAISNLAGDSVGDAASSFDWGSMLGDNWSNFVDAGDYGNKAIEMAADSGSDFWGSFFRNGGRVRGKVEPQKYALGGRVQQRVQGYTTPDKTPALQEPSTSNISAARRAPSYSTEGEMSGAPGFEANNDFSNFNTVFGTDTSSWMNNANNTEMDAKDLRGPDIGVGTVLSLLMNAAKATTPIGIAMLAANVVSAVASGKTIMGNVFDYGKDAISSAMSSIGDSGESASPDTSVSQATANAANSSTGDLGYAPADAPTMGLPDHSQLPSFAQGAFGDYQMSQDMIDYIWTIPQDQFDPNENFGDFGSMFYNHDSNAVNNILPEPGAASPDNPYGGVPDWANNPFYLNMNADGGKIVDKRPINTIGIRGRSNIDSTSLFGSQGKVPGRDPSNSDDVPALLTRGEYVIPVDVVDQLGQNFFDQLLAQFHAPA